MNGGHFLYMLALLTFRTPHFIESFLVEPVEQMDQAGNQQAEENEWQSRAVESRVEENRGSSAGDLRR
jgi:hypothetical protein